MKTKLACALALVGALNFAPSAQAAAEDNFNIRINPLGLLVGMFNASFDIGISDSVTVGPTLGFRRYTLFDATTQGVSVGARANIYVTGTKHTDGWYVGPNFNVNSMSYEDDAAKDTYTNFSVGALFGYAWFWDSGFNMLLGLGVQYIQNPKTRTIAGFGDYEVPGYTGMAPDIEWTMGVTF